MAVARKPTLVTKKPSAKSKAADSFAANKRTRKPVLLRIEESLLAEIDGLAKEYAAEHEINLDRNAWIVKTLREAVQRGGLAMERGKK